MSEGLLREIVWSRRRRFLSLAVTHHIITLEQAAELCELWQAMDAEQDEAERRRPR